MRPCVDYNDRICFACRCCRRLQLCARVRAPFIISFDHGLLCHCHCSSRAITLPRSRSAALSLARAVVCAVHVATAAHAAGATVRPAPYPGRSGPHTIVVGATVAYRLWYPIKLLTPVQAVLFCNSNRYNPLYSFIPHSALRATNNCAGHRVTVTERLWRG